MSLAAVAASPLVQRTRCVGSTIISKLRSQIRQDYPLNLSISVSGGKETNKDSPSNGE